MLFIHVTKTSKTYDIPAQKPPNPLPILESNIPKICVNNIFMKLIKILSVEEYFLNLMIFKNYAKPVETLKFANLLSYY